MEKQCPTSSCTGRGRRPRHAGEHSVRPKDNDYGLRNIDQDAVWYCHTQRILRHFIHRDQSASSTWFNTDESFLWFSHFKGIHIRRKLVCNQQVWCKGPHSLVNCDDCVRSAVSVCRSILTPGRSDSTCDLHSSSDSPDASLCSST